MARGCLSISCAVVLCALVAAGCGSSAINLDPGEITEGRGAIFGRVVVRDVHERPDAARPEVGARDMDTRTPLDDAAGVEGQEDIR